MHRTCSLILAVGAAGFTPAALGSTTSGSVDFNTSGDLSQFTLTAPEIEGVFPLPTQVVNYEEDAGTGTGGTDSLNVLRRNDLVNAGATDSGAATEPFSAIYGANAFDFTPAGVTASVSLDFLPTSKLHQSSNMAIVGFGIDPTNYGFGADVPMPEFPGDPPQTTSGFLANIKMRDANTGSNNGTDGAGVQLDSGAAVSIGVNLSGGIFGNNNDAGNPSDGSTGHTGGFIDLAYTEGAVAAVGSDSNNPGALGFYNPNEDAFHWHRLEGVYETVGADDVIGTVNLYDLGLDGLSTPTLIHSFSIDSSSYDLTNDDPDAGILDLSILSRNEDSAYAGFIADQARGPSSNKKNRGADFVDNFAFSVTTGGAVLAGDANNDGVVDLLDFDVLAQNFGGSTGNGASDGDFNGDGVVDLLDFDVLAQNFGATSPAAVPEPASLALLGLGGLAAFRGRRRHG